MNLSDSQVWICCLPSWQGRRTLPWGADTFPHSQSALTLRQRPAGGSSPCKMGWGGQRSSSQPKRWSCGAQWLRVAWTMPSCKVFSQTTPAPLFCPSLCNLLCLFLFLTGLQATDNDSEGFASKTSNTLRTNKNYVKALQNEQLKGKQGWPSLK